MSLHYLEMCEICCGTYYEWSRKSEICTDLLRPVTCSLIAMGNAGMPGLFMNNPGVLEEKEFILKAVNSFRS